MPMRYADRPAVLAALSRSDLVPADAPEIARIEQIEAGIAALLDREMGRSFGGAATVVSRTIAGHDSSLLLLPIPIRTVTTITMGGIAIPASSWAFWFIGVNGLAYGIRLLDGSYWPSIGGTIVVTGEWSDAGGGTLPVEIREAATFLTIEEYRSEIAGPSGAIGPDGLIVRTRNPWKFERVKKAIQAHRVRSMRITV